MPWLLWGYGRQTYEHRELIIVDSSDPPFESPAEDVRVIAAPAGAGVGEKRNMALDAARGEHVAWFDDDDWQHPERLAWLVKALGGGTYVAGTTRSWFLDLLSDRAGAYQGGRSVIFNGAGFRVDCARSVRFDESVRRAEDTVWLRALRSRGVAATPLPGAPILTFWLCHDSNLSNSRRRRRPRMRGGIGQLRSAIGLAAWADTDERLQALQEAVARRRPEATAHRNPTSMFVATVVGTGSHTRQ